MSIKNFFKSSSTKRTNQASKQKDQNPPMTSGTTSEDIFSDKSIPSIQIELTANSSSAADCRETFLTSKESVLIKKMFSEICSDSAASLEGTNDDKNVMLTITKLSYDWNIFFERKAEYLAGCLFTKKSKLKEQLGSIQKQAEVLRSLLNRISSFKVNNTKNAFELSQTYLRKAEVISDFITASSQLSLQISNKDLLSSLRRGINQQKLTSLSYSQSFYRNDGELLKFSCENNTQLSWEKVFQMLMDLEISNNNLLPVDSADLIHVALLISSNIVTHLAELNLTNKAIDVVVKLFTRLYVCNKDVHCFINIHEFVYTPGVFQTLLFVPDSVQMEEVATLLNENITQLAEPVKKNGGQ